MQPLRSNQIFRLSNYASTIEASNAAQDYCAQFNQPYRMRNSAPLIMFRYDKNEQGYVIEPNRNYYPNPAWNDLVKREKEQAAN